MWIILSMTLRTEHFYFALFYMMLVTLLLLFGSTYVWTKLNTEILSASSPVAVSICDTSSTSPGSELAIGSWSHKLWTKLICLKHRWSNNFILFAPQLRFLLPTHFPGPEFRKGQSASTLQPCKCLKGGFLVDSSFSEILWNNKIN